MNNQLRERYDALAEKTNELSFRERLIVAAAGAVIILALVDQLIMQPLISARKSLESQQQQLQNEADQLQARISSLEEQLRNHPSRKAASKIKDLKTLNERIDNEISAVTENLMAPQDMPFVLGELLSESSGLSVESLVTKPAEQLSVANEGQLGSTALYRHSMELTLEGSFFSVRDYLEAAEALPTQLIWDRMDYTILQHPKGRLTLVVHTLSAAEDFIRVVR